MLVKILLKYIMGYVRISVEGYYIERFINICMANKILIWNLKREKCVKLYLSIGVQDFYKIIDIAKKTQCKIKIVRKRGIPFIANKYRKRKIFIIALIIIGIMLYTSSKYVWNIEIKVEDNSVLENIESDIKDGGLNVGMRKDKVNIEEIVNKIRLKRTDVSWIGINLKGTNAIVKVVKAKEAPNLIDEKEYCNIVAKKGGTITEIIAQNGTALVKNGDQVKEGQVLIQGTMEGKYTGIRYVHSLGEVKAIVEYTKIGKIPLKEEQNVKTGKKEEKYEIKFNDFQINFYKTLSKFENYDTINENKKLKLLSNFYLPIEIIKKTNYEYKYEEKIYTEEELAKLTEEKIEKDLDEKVSQKENIINKQTNIYPNEDYIEVEVIYEVLENIGSEDKIIF